MFIRLKMPQFTCITSGLEVIIVDKAKKTFYQKNIQLQNFLLMCHMGDSRYHYKGLKVIQEYFYYKEKPAGFLKAQIIMAQCTLDREQIIELYDYGMIDFIVFNRPEETYYFGEKIQIIIGNITTS